MKNSSSDEATGAPLAASARATRLAFFGFETSLLMAVTLVTAYLVVPPLFSVIQTSLFTTTLTGELQDLTLQYYRQILDHLSSPLINTLYFAVGSALLATAIGGSIAWIVTRTNTPLCGLGYFAAFASFGTPFVLYTIAWLLLLGKSGPLNHWARELLGVQGVVFDVYSLAGMTLIEGFQWSPLVFLMLAASFSSMDPSLEEASTACGATVRQTIHRISLRLAFPAIYSVALLVFIRSFEAFEIPALVGLPGDIRVITTSIYLDAKRMPPRYGSAGAFSVALMLMVSAALYLYARATREASRFQTVTGRGYRPRLIDLGLWRYATASVLVVYFFCLLVLPLLIILWASLLPFYSPPSLDAISRWTLNNYVVAMQFPKITNAMKNSLLLGIGSATMVMALTTVGSWVLVRTRLKGRWLLDLLTTMPLVFPGIVMGLAIMRFYLLVPVPIYGTLWILLVAYFARYIPYGIRYTHSGLLHLDRELEEAAYVSGASWLNCLRRVILPLLSPSFFGGWVFVFLLSARELSMSILLSGPRTPVVSVAIFDLWENGQAGELAALGVIWAGILSSIAMVYYAMARRYGFQLH